MMLVFKEEQTLEDYIPGNAPTYREDVGVQLLNKQKTDCKSDPG